MYIPVFTSAVLFAALLVVVINLSVSQCAIPFMLSGVTPILRDDNISRNCNCTRYERSFQKLVLTRVTRQAVFPKKAYLLLTLALSKAIVGGTPRGLILTIEFNLYSPLPDSIETWKPTILIKKLKGTNATTKAAKTKMTATHTNTTFLSAYPDHDDHSDVTYAESFSIEPSSWNDYKQRAGYQWSRKFYYGNGLPWQTSKWNPYERRNWKTPNYYTRMDHTIKYLHANAVKGQRVKLPDVNNKDNLQIHAENISGNNHWSEPEVYKTVDEVPSWKYHRDYRERREIFDQLEGVGKILKVNMKACILRAMCEVRTELLPSGESLIHDIIRIILTVPTDHDFDDDYSNMARRKNILIDCAMEFALTCPFPVLGYLIKNLNNIFEENNFSLDEKSIYK